MSLRRLFGAAVRNFSPAYMHAGIEICFYSWLLCSYVYPGSRRPTSRQFARLAGWYVAIRSLPQPPLITLFIQVTFSMVYTFHSSHILLPTYTLSVDFGYILGRDPKPFPPPVKVCKEMVDAMGGAGSAHYAKFKNYCFTAFSILRKSANLILNLVALMVDANIPDIKHRDVHEQVQEKFRLDLTEEEAIKHFETLLNEWSYFTVVFDRIHDIAQVCTGVYEIPIGVGN